MSLLVLLWPLWLIRRPEAESPLWARRSLILLITALTLRYLHWRIFESLNLESAASTAISLVLLLAEAWLLISGLLQLWLAWRRFPDRRSQINAVRTTWKNSDWTPRIDILIPTYGEPLEVLERTFQGCRELNYPHKTIWVLDDSGRDQVQQLAKEMGCRYRHRPERAHAKAGNLNDGLRLGHGELVAVFDADVIPQQNFLDDTVGFLINPEIALIQTPQHSLNADPLMRNLGMEQWLVPDEESFYRWIQPVRDAWGAVVCAGTSFVVKRRALEQIGGFVEQALSEDLVTGIALREQGWRLVYLQQKLSAGLAAERMLDFVHQRQRWATGTLQSLSLAQGPLRAKGLSIGERLAYLEGVIHWINHLPRLLLMLMPLSIGLLGVLPIRISTEAVLEQMLPLWGVVMLSIGWLNRNSRAALSSELTGWVLTVPLTLNLFRKTRGFKTTPKHLSRPQTSVAWGLMVPMLFLLGLNALNLLGLLIGDANTASESAAERGLGVLWAGLNLIATAIAVRACWDPAMEDPVPWFSTHQSAEIIDAGGHRNRCTISAISERGAELTQAGQPGPLSGSSAMRWNNQPLPLPFRVETQDNSALSVTWSGLNRQQQRSLRRWLYQRPRCWVDRQAPMEWRSLLALLRRITAWTGIPGQRAHSMVPLTGDQK